MTHEQALTIWPILIEVGINPVSILSNPMFPQMAKEYIQGRWTKAEFQAACENLNILSGGKLKGAPPKRIPMTSLN